MQRYELAYGKSTAAAEISSKNIQAVLSPINNGTTGAVAEGADEVSKALSSPIGAKRLSEIVQPGERVCIITSDITRPLPTHIVLPPVLNELYLAGVGKQEISVAFGLGAHRKHTAEEMRQLVGSDIFKEINCLDHDPAHCIRLGNTSRGTPVDIFNHVVEADRRICLGNIEFHYFAGYSGGAKAIMPGVTSTAAIQANHSRMVETAAAAGILAGNPVREDIEEVTRFLSIDFILNVVLDEKKNILRAFAGHPVKAHREGCLYLDSLYKQRIPGKADIVLVSAGGYPKDINLYQAQKALDNAKHAVKRGGIIILVAQCGEGLGNHLFEKWITLAKTPRDIVARVKDDFELGGHKAAAIALILERAEVFFVSDLRDELVKKMFMTPFSSVQEAVDCALTKKGAEAQVTIMPAGGSTLPIEEKRAPN